MPGQYIECTCKLTTSIIMMTNNIMIFNQLLLMQHYMSTCYDQARTSLRTAYQLWSSLDHKHTTIVVFLKNNSWSLRRSQPRPTLGLQPWSLRRSQPRPIFGPWSLRRSQPLISSSKYRRDSSRLSHSSSYHILVITYLFTNLIILVCPPFRPRPDSGTYYLRFLSIDFIHTLQR